jgi:branched-chain amino acid transport system permease protein
MRRLNRASAGWALFFALAATVPLTHDIYILSVALNIAVFALLAIGMNIVVGYAGLLDLGYIAFFAAGSYTTAILMQDTSVSFWIAWPMSGLVAGIFGIAIGVPTLRLRMDYLAIVTLGFGEITRLVINNLEFTGGPTGIYNIRQATGFGWEFTQTGYYYLALGMLAIGVAFSAWVRSSRLGAAWTYIRHDEEVARAVGVNPLIAKLAAYALGAVWGGLAGGVFVEASTAVSPTSFIFAQSLLVVLAVILGGQGSLSGAILGSIMVVGVPEWFRSVESWRMLAFGGVLVLLMIFRPEGLIRQPLTLREEREVARRMVPRSNDTGDESANELPAA